MQTIISYWSRLSGEWHLAQHPMNFQEVVKPCRKNSQWIGTKRKGCWGGETIKWSYTNIGTIGGNQSVKPFKRWARKTVLIIQSSLLYFLHMGATVLSSLLFSTWYEIDINWFLCKQTRSFLSKLKQTKEVFPSSAVSKVEFFSAPPPLKL